MDKSLFPKDPFRFHKGSKALLFRRHAGTPFIIGRKEALDPFPFIPAPDSKILLSRHIGKGGFYFCNGMHLIIFLFFLVEWSKDLMGVIIS